MNTYRLISLFMATILLNCCFLSCISGVEEFFVQDGTIRLTSEITSTSRVIDQTLQSTQIVEGQQVGVTITGAASEHENVAWVVAKNGSLSNTDTFVYWGSTDATITAYHPYNSSWIGTNHTFTVSTDQSKEEGYLNSDLLWAITTASATTNPVALNFTHKLSKINVTLVNKGNENISNATITLCGVNIATGFNPQTGELYAVTENVADIKASVTTESAYTASAIIVPQTMKSGSRFIKITFEDKDYHYTLPEEQVFESGQVYHFTIELNISDNSNAKTDYVDLKFDMPGVSTSYNGSTGSLTIAYLSGGMPSVKEGKAVVLPEEYGFDIRVIESFSISGNTLTMKTSKGNMGNLFRNTSFTLTTDADVSSRSANTNVYTPVAYGYIDKNGTYHELYNESRAVYPIENFKWEAKIDFNGEKIYEGQEGTLSWDKCELSAGLKGTFTFDFGEKTINEVRSVGDLKRIDYKLTGNVDMDMLLHYKYESEYKESGDEIIKYNVIPMGHFTFKVPIGSVRVPIHLQIYTHLGKMYACQIEGKVNATAGVKAGNEVSVGLEWTQEGGAKPIKEVNPYFEFYPLTVEAQASIESKVSYYPQWEIGIYGFKAIWLEPRPYLKEKVETGFRASMDGENHIGWKAETYNGMDLRMGLETEFGFWRKDIWTSPIYNVVEDHLLFEAPSRIIALSPENNIIVEKGESVTAEFMVESFSPITNKFYPCPLALVNFEPETGELDKPLAVTDLEGKAMVNWTPSPTMESRSSELVERTLTAKVIDKEDASIDEATLIIRTEEDNLRAALIKLYKSTNGDNWTHNDNWGSEKDINEWYGVYKYKDKCRLSLANNNLTGYIDQTFPDNVNIYLDCENNLLTFLNVSGCSSLRILDCNDNQLNSLDVSGCANLSELNCLNNQLTSLKASGCASLSSLSLNKMQLTSLDVSGCTSLTRLDCFNNQLTSLDVSGCSSLATLYCYDNQLTSLDVSGCTSLTRLDCFNNQLSSLDVSGCSSLTDLSCNDNQLTSLNVSGCVSLTYLSCYNNQLTSLDVSGFISLTRLNCYNNQLNSLDVSGCSSLATFNFNDNQLTSLDVSGCTSLSTLSLGKMQLSSLNVSGCSSLKYLYCNDNLLTSLNVSGCTSLTGLDCDNNQLVSLDVSGCTSLTRLDCYNNQLTSLNVSGCTNLKELRCYDNLLVSLDVSGCTSLTRLNCYNNQLSSPLDVSNFILLTDLRCENNLLTSLNASGCTSLTVLRCYNNQLISLDVSGCTNLNELSCKNNQLSSLNVSGYTSLKSLNCENNPLTSLNASGCTSLSTLNLSKMQLTTLNVSGCTSLTRLNCYNNQLTTLNVSGCTNLYELTCYNNQLSSLDVSGCSSLTNLSCNDNQLTSLNVSGCNALVYLFCANNRINQEIPDWFAQLTTFSYDIKYKYYNENGDKKWKDQGYGWWYPGEPEKGYHGQ